jgi:hypothetical protein
MSLSVCLLTRNEEENIGRAIRSVSGIANEVLVADTGSTDRTAQVALALGARVGRFAWGDDFAAARNFALDQARGEWVLWLNPDEELAPEAQAAVAEALARPDALAYILRVRELLTDGRPAKEAETHQPRLFRRDSGARYAGRLHCHFRPPLKELAAQQGRKVCELDATIVRHAYLSKQTPEKLQWAARLLELELLDRPGQLHYMIEYGRTLLLLNNPCGHEVLAGAADRVLAARHASAAPGATVGSLLEYVLTVSPEQSKCRMSTAEAEDLALRWFARTPPLVWAVAQRRFQAGDFPGAAGLLERLVEMGRTGEYDHAAGFDPDVVGAPALMNLGVCYIRTKQWDRACRCFGQLQSHPTYHAQARANLAVAESGRRQAQSTSGDGQ